MDARKPVVFFAIPCGGYYTIQADTIRRVCDVARIFPDIIEDDPSTEGLWDKITQRIDAADYFVADVSSKSPNIVVELGYAIARKPIGRIAVFIASNVPIPSDLGGLLVQKYASLSDFQRKLIDWLTCSVPLVNPEEFARLESPIIDFSEDFKDQDVFMRRWITPPHCSYLLTHEGLRFSWAHMPILTNTLAILGDCEFEFDARIDQRRIGWAVKGTKPYDIPTPIFLIMFNLNTKGVLLPHIWTAADPQPQKDYHPYQSEAVSANIQKSEDGWFTILTRVRGDTVEILNADRVLFSADFSQEPYAAAYSSIPEKMGQVGFRCHPGEIATVSRVRVKEI
jgi:hypothetical protein